MKCKNEARRSTVFSAWSIHLVFALLGPRHALTKRSPTTEGENPSSNKNTSWSPTLFPNPFRHRPHTRTTAVMVVNRK